MSIQRFRHAPILLPVLAFGLSCGGSGQQANRTSGLARLRAAIEQPVNSPEESRAHSQLVEETLSNDALSGMTREEVRTAIGAGDACSRHPRCAENGFEDDDWHYTVGAMGTGPAGNIPVFIVGFDNSGHVTRTWNLRVE